MNVILEGTVALFFVAVLVALAARRLSLPYTVGLVAAGVGLALAHVSIEPQLMHDAIFELILPPLLFEAALSVHWRELRRDMLPTLVLSVLGVAVSTAVVAAGMVILFRWPLASACVFGALIAATDPVAVISLFSETGVKGRLRLLVEGESLFNDGVAVVLFAAALEWATNSHLVPAAIGTSLALSTGGGIAVGLVSGLIAVLLIGRTDDRLAETALTATAAYGSFLIAERLECSGVIATVSAGLVLGNIALARGGKSTLVAEDARTFLLDFWEFAAFVANSFVFLMIGLTAAHVPLASSLGVGAIAVTIGLVLVARLLTVYPLCGLFAFSRWAIPWRYQHILWWGGLRGALPLALALTLPDSLPMCDEILIATFGVVVFSVIVQGLTMKPLMRRLGFVT